MIKLLALDLDGTLLNSRGKISDENKQAIRKAEEKGVLVTIATGRRFRDALPIALEGEFNAPIITHNGALLKFAKTLETIAASTIKTETVTKVLRVGNALCGDALLSADPHGKGTLYYDTVSEKNIPLQKYIAWSKILHGDEAETAIIHVENLDEIVETVETVHVSFSGRCEPMFEMQKILNDELKDSVNILATVYTHLDFTLLDILPPGASKAHGVNELAKIHNLTSENVMTIGDNFNDLEMLEYAGTPVLMGNATPELLEREDFYTTLSNDEHGVAEAIERFILN